MSHVTPKTDAFFDRARKVLPFGVSSNLRYWGKGDDIGAARAQGAYIWDLEGSRYIDYRLAFGPVTLGCGHPAVAGALCPTTGRLSVGRRGGCPDKGHGAGTEAAGRGLSTSAAMGSPKARSR